jgi:precorrin-6A/cobalt-precorrin-6A reductase
MIDNQGSAMTRILLLGGTTEAGQLARALAEAGMDAVYSYAGRTSAPALQPLPQRVGGFGGVAGLVSYLRAEAISHVVDATHPFAADMSRNAVAACAEVQVPLMALERPGWIAGEGDRWTHVGSGREAAAALPRLPARVFLAIGRQTLGDFVAAPQHHFLLRLVDPPTDALPLPLIEVVLGRGPFRLEDDLDLMRRHGTQIVVTKNAGGDGARAKLDAARMLGLEVIMIDRPALPDRPTRATVVEVMGWLHGADRGV